LSAYEQIASIINEINQLDDNKIIEGQELLLPPLPKKPFTEGASDKLSQRMDTETVQTLLHNSKDSQDIPGNPRKGRVWEYSLTKNESDAFLERLPENQKSKLLSKSIYLGPKDEVVRLAVSPVKNLKIETIKNNLEYPVSPVKSIVEKLEAKSAGYYYILDFFNPTDENACTHGRLVMDKAIALLNNYGASHLAKNIIPIELSFYDNKDFAVEEMAKYVNGYGDIIAANLNQIKETLKDSDEPPSDFSSDKAIPLFYLNALYSNLLADQNTSIISSQYYAYIDGYETLPATYIPKSDVPLISAVLDDSVDTVEEVIGIEPIRSFRDKRLEYGVSLVGAFEAGVPFGMYSRDGNGVTFLDDGVVEGFSEACKGVLDKGTSFSTPSIGIKMFLAKAYWKMMGIKVNAFEEKIRFLLASDIVPSYVSNYASAGVPRLERLLKPDGPSLIKQDNSVIVLDREDFLGNMQYKTNHKGSVKTQNFERDGGISGLQVVDGQTYIFTEAKLKWEKVDVIRISIIINRSMPEIRSIMEFSKQYKGVSLI
jgi:hypothetical protein